tara:strand:- start:106 stop:303 length:198 start_codon:yes stop_codon:yes gene_type:complete
MQLKTYNMKTTFIIIDSLGSVHAHIKANNAHNAKSIYTEGFTFLENISFAITNKQYSLINKKHII